MKELGDALFHDNDIKLVSVIEIRVSEEISRKRVLSESSTKEEIALFEHKMEVYSKLIGEIENFYNKDGLLTVIDGEQEQEKVIEAIDTYMKTQVALFA